MQRYTNVGSVEIRICIAESSLSLLQNEDFDDIRINEICDAAHIGKTTYYRYYNAKDGKKEALLFYLRKKYDEWQREKKDLYESSDDLFLNFLYSIQGTLRLLYRNDLIHLIDNMFFDIQGPPQSEELYYFYYGGIGLSIGLMRGILHKDFSDPPATISKSFAIGLHGLADKIRNGE